MATRLSNASNQISQNRQNLGLTEVRNLIDAGLVFTVGGATTGSTATTGTGPTTTAPGTPAGASANLQALLAAIPIAMDGQVITAEHHNSLRAAIITLANQLGMGLTSPTTTYTYAPSLLPISGTPANWSVTGNLIAQGAVAANPDGWLPVQLPHGQTIQQMTVTGRLTAPAPSSFNVTLFRESVDSAAKGPTALITVPLQGQSGGFSESGAVTTGAAPSNSAAFLVQQVTAQDLKLIDTENYKYFVRATVTGAGTATQAEIDAIQIVVGS